MIINSKNLVEVIEILKGRPILDFEDGTVEIREVKKIG